MLLTIKAGDKNPAAVARAKADQIIAKAKAEADAIESKLNGGVGELAEAIAAVVPAGCELNVHLSGIASHGTIASIKVSAGSEYASLRTMPVAAISRVDALRLLARFDCVNITRVKGSCTSWKPTQSLNHTDSGELTHLCPFTLEYNAATYAGNRRETLSATITVKGGLVTVSIEITADPKARHTVQYKQGDAYLGRVGYENGTVESWSLNGLPLIHQFTRFSSGSTKSAGSWRGGWNPGTTVENLESILAK